MISNIDKPKILDAFKKAKSQDLLHINIDSRNKDSLKLAIKSLEKFLKARNGKILVLK